MGSGEMRDVIFISKATPGDDEFVLWLAPRLEAAGYKVFADILSLQAGDRWRRTLTTTLQDKAAKMLLCCSDTSLARVGVQEEIGIAEDVSKELSDPRFIIPLRLEKFKKVFGIGELHYVNFVGSWASGLQNLLEELENANVPRVSNPVINPDWENYKKRLAVKVEAAPEVLTSNWLRITDVPDVIRYYEPTGAIDHDLLQRMCQESRFPAQLHAQGIFFFGTLEEMNQDFSSVGKFTLRSEYSFTEFLEEGSRTRHIKPREAKSMLYAMLRQSWEALCREKAFYEYQYSSHPGFHVTKDQVPLRKRIPWGRQGDRRSSMLRNVAGGKVWQFGVSAVPHFWPFMHFRLKSRVLFSELAGKEAGAVFADAMQQHRLRRTICKGWRNKAWHGRLMAFLELMSGEAPYIDLRLSDSVTARLDATPIPITVPVTTVLPNILSDDTDDNDTSTLGDFDAEDAA